MTRLRFASPEWAARYAVLLRPLADAEGVGISQHDEWLHFGGPGAEEFARGIHEWAQAMAANVALGGMGGEG